MTPSPEPAIVRAASELAGAAVLEALNAKAAELSPELPGVPVKVIAAALSHRLAAELKSVTAALILEAEGDLAGHRSRVRIQVAELVGSHRQAIQRAYKLADAKGREPGGEPAADSQQS